jgi:hypothetical protein
MNNTGVKEGGLLWCSSGDKGSCESWGHGGPESKSVEEMGGSGRRDATSRGGGPAPA